MATPTAAQVQERIDWHRQRVSELDVQIAGMVPRSLSPVRRRLKGNRQQHLKTIKLLEKLIC